MKEVNEMMFSILFVSIISLAASVVSMIIAHKMCVVARETAELNRVLAERYATLADLVFLRIRAADAAAVRISIQRILPQRAKYKRLRRMRSHPPLSRYAATRLY